MVALPDNLPGHEAVLSRFNRLFRALLRDEIKQNVFSPWELSFLLDIAACPPKTRSKRALKQYRETVQRQFEEDAPIGGEPMLFSEYLRQREKKKRRCIQAKSAQ